MLTTNRQIPRIENDLNNDGILDVRDATALQLYIAESATLDIEGVKMADINKDRELLM